MAEHMFDAHMVGIMGVDPQGFGRTLGHADAENLYLIAEMVRLREEKHHSADVPIPKSVSKKEIAAILEASQLFEYNISGHEWTQTWESAANKVGVVRKGNGAGIPYGSAQMGAHMRDKFFGTHKGALYNLFGNADGINQKIISQMIADRAKKHDREKIQYVLRGD
jgi:hypothetical protein